MLEAVQSEFIDAQHEDGRKSLRGLYEACQPLLNSPDWESEVVCQQRVLEEKGEILGHLPIISIRTKIKGKAIWVIAGIHGEEPAGPIALAENIQLFEDIRKAGIPVVLLPMCNPAGYFRDWRYMNARRGDGLSVGDSDHLLANEFGEGPRTNKPALPESAELVGHALKLCNEGWPPHKVFDLHEDEDDAVHPRNVHPYLYVLSHEGSDDPSAQRVVEILDSNGMPITRHGITRFGEKIENGLVANKADGSIDEMLFRQWVYLDGVWRKKEAAKVVVTVETPTLNTPLKARIKARIKAQTEVLTAIPELWSL